jgi:hypothetical protein
MDTLPVIEVTIPQHQDLRDHRDTIIGKVERQSLPGRMIVRDHRGIALGSYDRRYNETRNARGQLVGRGNILSVLLVGAR